MNHNVTQPDPNCVPVPPFKRLNYHYGQMLGARDFQTEQDYFRHKMLLQNRCLHGWGVVCGLLVEPASPGQPDPADPKRCPTRVAISCGLGLDLEGHELTVRDPLCVDLWQHLPDEEKKEFEDARNSNRDCPLYIVLCFQQVPVDKQPVEFSQDCLASNTHTYAKWCESVCVRVTSKKPPAANDEPCEPCCTPYAPYGQNELQCCLWLARIDNFEPYQAVQPEDIHNEIRRPLSPYRPTVITGINWVHGAIYQESCAQWLISEDHGLRIRFSRPVAKDTIEPGIVDIWRTTQWTSSPGNISVLPAILDTLPAGKQEVDELRIRVLRKYKDLSEDDRVLIRVRCDFILDSKCGRAVDGNHIGGRVGLLAEDVPKNRRKAIENAIAEAGPLPTGASGNGTPGGVFESWFRVTED